jgi:glucose-6-phosphate isomerase
MSDLPSAVQIKFAKVLPRTYDSHIVRTLSALRGQFYDAQAYSSLLAQGDEPLYEVYEFKRPEVVGELLSGISIVHPGKVGNEYFMTKGHFHQVLETAGVYYCLSGRGMMVMETPEGESSVEDLAPGVVLYVPPRWAHRSVNTSPDEDLVTFFVYPANAGHDYGTIEPKGFRKLMVERDGKPSIIDNPKWQG